MISLLQNGWTNLIELSVSCNNINTGVNMLICSLSSEKCCSGAFKVRTGFKLLDKKCRVLFSVAIYITP